MKYIGALRFYIVSGYAYASASFALKFATLATKKSLTAKVAEFIAKYAE
jgi:hypothetical protein